MQNCKMLIENNFSQCKVGIEKNKVITIKHKREKHTEDGKEYKIFNSYSLMKMLNEIGSAGNKFFHRKNKVIIEFDRIVFADKLCYILLECMIYSLIVDYGQQVVVKYGQHAEVKNMAVKETIQTCGFAYSGLYKGITSDSNQVFTDNFSKYDISMRHYRKIINSAKGHTEGEDDDVFSVLMVDVNYFLTHIFTGDGDKKYIDELTEVIIELVTNAWEHGKSDCLLDIDVANDFWKVDNPEGEKFGGINIAIVNFSSNLFWNGIQNKMETYTESKARYSGINEAHETHCDLFDARYNENSFYIIAAFQDKISGRCEDGETGGTGLTKLLASLQRQSEANNCYILSGRNIVYLSHKYLQKNDDNWVGFNCSGDFLGDIPLRNLVNPCNVYMPGTAYNLTFIIKQENENDKCKNG